MHIRNPLTWLTSRAVGKLGRWVTVGLWVAVLTALTIVAPKLADYYNNAATSSIGNQESVRAAALLKQEFPSQNGLPAIIVVNDPNGLNASDQQTVAQISCWLLSDAQRVADHCPTVTGPARPDHLGPVVSTFTLPFASSGLVSADGTTTTIVVALQVPDSDAITTGTIITAIRAFIAQQGLHAATVQINVTGPAGIINDLVDVFKSTDLPLLLTIVGLVLVLLLVIYRSPLLAFLPLVGVGLALQIVNPILGVAAKAALFPISQQATSIMQVLLFGAGTDYVIFIVARYREELQSTPDHILALRTTMQSVGEAITSSAGTVILGLLALSLAVLGLYSSLGYVLAIAVAVMLLAGLTLIPALLSILGRAAFWPFIPKQQTTAAAAPTVAPKPPRGFWPAIARFVARRPIIAVVASIVLLGVLALGNLGVPDVYNSLTDLRKPTDATRGYQVLAQHFEPGTLAPFTVVLHFTDGTNAYQHLAAIDQIDQAVAGVTNVASVSGPTRIDGQTLIQPDLAALQTAFAQLPPAEIQAVRAGTAQAPTGVTGSGPLPPIALYAETVQYVANDNATVKLQVTLKIDPYSVPALDEMAAVRTAAKNAVAQSGLNANATQILLAGVTPQLADTRAVSDHDKLVVVPLVLGLVAIVLALLLRSLVAPLYLLFAVTLNYFAAIGASAFLFTKIQGDEGMSYATPLYTFIFLVALGADYTIFLMSRGARRGRAARVARRRAGGAQPHGGRHHLRWLDPRWHLSGADHPATAHAL